MAEEKNTLFDRPGGYAMPSGAAGVHREVAASKVEMVLPGDAEPPFSASSESPSPLFQTTGPDSRVYLGDCREVLANLPDRGKVDLVFADPPFNWDVPYDEWKDNMSRSEYERFTYDWLDACIDVLSPTGSLWVNIPDDTAAEVVMHLKRRGLTMINWCVWHFRFGQCRHSSFIMSKVHVLYFVKNADERTWNPDEILEQSDRASVYKDARTMAKDTNKGMRVPMDVWYGSYLGRIQGNNKERRHGHHNQIPEAYLERVIRATSNPGDLVLDPFLGSGTTSTVARALDRRNIGVEFSETNAKSAWERITSIGMVRSGTTGGSSAIHSKRGKSKDRS